MINAKQFLLALEELSSAKGISQDSILTALKEAMEKAFKKQLGKEEDAQVKVDIDSRKGTIEMFILKTVVQEVEDDFLEISLEDANKEGQRKYEIGELYEIPVPTDELTKLAAQNVKSVLRQKIAEAEKAALYAVYADKIGEMIVGTVEKIDERSTIVNIGRTSVYLPNNQKIGDETFRLGEQIKLYVVDVVSTTKGAQINVSRSDEGFLKRLFEEEIHEVFDGTVVIKTIAREAGERSKVAVFSTDPNVDATGACIGPNGSRIQKICAALGNAKDKEKIDVISYNENPGLYIIEALKPASIVGVAVDYGNKKATAVVFNNQLSLAIGKRGVNARLAVKLTGWNIDIKEQDEALGLGIKFLSVDELRRDYISYATRLAREAAKVQEAAAMENEEITLVEAAPQEVVPQEVTEEVPPMVMEEKVEVVLPVSEEVAPIPVPPVVKEEKPVEKVEQKRYVQTKINLADLEKELENEKRRRDRAMQGYERKTYKARNEEEEKKAFDFANKDAKPTTPTVDPKTYMQIYTEEELAELEKEEMEDKVFDENDIDYDEFDEYYEDDAE